MDIEYRKITNTGIHRVTSVVPAKTGIFNDFFTDANIFANEYNFKNSKEHEIWDLFVEGLSQRKIAAKLKTTRMKRTLGNTVELK